MLERFAQFVEQPSVLDGDDGLCGEILNQLDLLVGKGAHLLAVDIDRADQLVVFQQRHFDQRPAARDFDSRDAQRIAFGISLALGDVFDLDEPLCSS